MGRIHNARRAFPAGVAIVLAVLLGALGWGTHACSPDARALTGSGPRPQFHEGPVVDPLTGPASFTADGGAGEPPAPGDGPEEQHVTPLDPPPIDLPPSTQRLAQEFVPGTTVWNDARLRPDSNLMLRILPAKYNVVRPAPIVVYVEVRDASNGERKPIDSVQVRLRPYPREGEAPAEWIRVAAPDDGRRADEQRGDHVYTATYDPPSDTPLRGHVMVDATVPDGSGGVRQIPTSLIYTEGPDAKLTGRWRDSIRGGHLVLEAEMSVGSAGTFSLMAQLVGPNREPIALVRDTASLEAGLRWFSLPVWGKALHDRAVDGRYQVRNVLLSRENPGGAEDYSPAPTVISAHTTAYYVASAFSSEAYASR